MTDYLSTDEASAAFHAREDDPGWPERPTRAEAENDERLCKLGRRSGPTASERLGLTTADYRRLRP